MHPFTHPNHSTSLSSPLPSSSPLRSLYSYSFSLPPSFCPPWPLHFILLTTTRPPPTLIIVLFCVNVFSNPNYLEVIPNIPICIFYTKQLISPLVWSFLCRIHAIIIITIVVIIVIIILITTTSTTSNWKLSSGAIVVGKRSWSHGFGVSHQEN